MNPNVDETSKPAGPVGQAAQTWVARLGRVRHDLRNPLSEILGFSEILQEEATEPALQPILPGVNAMHQTASRIFAEVNHWLSQDSVGQNPQVFQDLEQTIHNLSERIISGAENLSEKCDELQNNSVGDDLLRIQGAARRLRDGAPAMLRELAASLPTSTGTEPVGASSGDSVETTARSRLMQETRAEAGSAAGSLLVVDDNESNRALLARRLRRQGYTVSLAENGRQALEKLHVRRFDLVLLDVIMPEMGGYPVLEKIKADPVLRHIPVIMISALDDLDMLARCIQKGAEDYLAKPFDAVLLGARIGSSLEKKRLHDQEERTYRALLESQKHLAAELAEAVSYVKSLLPAPLKGDISADWRFIPSSQLGGDAFGYCWLDADHFAVYLLDVCSHGVGAALLSITVMNVLRSQNLQGVDFRHPGQVLAALNRAFPMESQNHLYFTLWYGVIDKNSRRLKYSSAGHPPAILLTGADRARVQVERLRTSGAPVGTFPESSYTVQETTLQPFTRLYVFSDGAYEIIRQNGSMLTLDDLVQHLQGRAAAANEELQATLSYLENARGTASFEDDLAIIEISLG